jgi:hypothetical protein
MVLPITLIKYAQQDAEPQNKKSLRVRLRLWKEEQIKKTIMQQKGKTYQEMGDVS